MAIAKFWCQRASPNLPCSQLKQAQPVRRHLTAFVVCLCLPFMAMGQTVVEVLAGADQKLLAYLASTQSLRADFLHEQISTGGRLQRFSGQMALSRPGQFRWEIKKPYSQLQLIDGKQFLLYDPDLNQLTERTIDDALDATPAGLLLSSGPMAKALIEKRFELTNLPDRDGLQWVRLSPKAKGEASKALLEVGMNEVGELAAFFMQDAMGRQSRVLLSNRQRNLSLPKSLFEFDPPQGTERLRQ